MSLQHDIMQAYIHVILSMLCMSKQTTTRQGSIRSQRITCTLSLTHVMPVQQHKNHLLITNAEAFLWRHYKALLNSRLDTWNNQRVVWNLLQIQQKTAETTKVTFWLVTLQQCEFVILGRSRRKKMDFSLMRHFWHFRHPAFTWYRFGLCVVKAVRGDTRKTWEKERSGRIYRQINQKPWWHGG